MSTTSTVRKLIAVAGMVLLCSQLGLATAADKAPVQDRRIGDDAQKRYFLIGLDKESKAPAGGYGLLIVLPGGDGSADFHDFVRDIHRNVLKKGWLLAQAVAPKWDEQQFEQVVWPTEKLPYAAAKFTTEEFLEAIVKDVKAKAKLDSKRVYLLGWSSGGPPCYSFALRKDSPVTGAFIAMSVFKPKLMPPLKNAKGKAFYLLQSPDDRITRLQFAEAAEKALRDAGAKVKLQQYEGGHGWHGERWKMIGDGIAWLEEQAKAKR